MAAWERVEAAELAALRWALRTRESLTVHRAVASVTSMHAGQDLTSCVALASAAALWRIGFRLWWALCVAYVLGFFGRALLDGMRPQRRDYRLAPALLSLRGSAAVSDLVLFATVVCAELALASSSDWAMVLCAVAWAVCVHSRFLSLAYFPRQLAASALLGAGSVALTAALQARLPERLSSNGNIRLAVALGSGMLLAVELMLRVEQEDVQVRAFCTPKREYVRVLDGIMASEPALRPQTKPGVRPPRDSFVKLVRSMERRSLKL